MHGRGVVKLREASNISTWNVKVRTMHMDGKPEILEREMKSLNTGCLGISDTYWSRVGHFLSDSGSTEGSKKTVGSGAKIEENQRREKPDHLQWKDSAEKSPHQ